MSVINLKIEGMSCAACAARVEKTLANLPGVEEAYVNLAIEMATVKYDPSRVGAEEMMAAVTKTGYGAHLLNPSDPLADVREKERELKQKQKLLIFAAAFSLPFLVIMLGHFLGFELPEVLTSFTTQIILATPVQFIAGFPFYRGAYFALCNRTANMDVLVSLGISAAYLYSLFAGLVHNEKELYFEVSTLLVTLILLGKFLETKAKVKTTEAIRRLMELKPKTALVIREGIETEIPTSEVVLGDLVIVRPGERIPIDGVVKEGTSAVDESMLTGEIIPAGKEPGDKLAAGTVNLFGSLKFEATGVGQETTLAQIIRAVEEAQGSKAPIQNLADLAAGYFVPAVIGISLITFLIWYLGASPGDLAQALINATAVLVIACPCAMGLATPTSIMVATGRAAENGILIRGGEYLELAHRIDTVVLDKTGTLTEGKIEVTDIIVDEKQRDEEMQILSLLAQVEKRSEHPIAQAIVKKIEEIVGSLPEIETADFQTTPGKGVSAKIAQEQIIIGTRRWLEEQGIDATPLRSAAEKLEREGRTVVWAAKGEKLVALLGIADKVKDNAYQVVQTLKEMGIEVLMITGDHRNTATAIARQVGIEKVLAEVLPQDKAKEIQKLKDEGRIVAMVGDGINDAPALATADIGIAMGTGTDIAMEAAGITIIGGNLQGVVTSLRLSRATMRNIKQNLFWAFIYNLAGIPLASAGLLSPIIAGGAMALSSVSVVTNALRLKKIRLA